MKTAIRKQGAFITFTLFAVMATPLNTTNACSYLNFKANGHEFIGRTNELPFETDEQLVIVPRGHTFHGIELKLGFVGIKHGEDPFVSSGLNEYGLSMEGLGLGESNFAPKGDGDMSMLKVPAYVLGNANSVDQAVELLKKIKAETDNMTQFGDTTVGFHFALNDGKRAVVVEYTNGKGTPDIYENKLGVMTNDPLYPEQEKLAQALIDTAELPEDRFRGFDKSPEGRFQQIVATNITKDLSRVKTDFDAVNYAWSMVNALEIPQGLVYWTFLSNEPQMTAYANVVDIANRAYYLRTYDNMEIRKVDLKKIDFSKVKYQAQDIYRTSDSYKEVEIR